MEKSPIPLPQNSDASASVNELLISIRQELIRLFNNPFLAEEWKLEIKELLQEECNEIK